MLLGACTKGMNLHAMFGDIFFHLAMVADTLMDPPCWLALRDDDSRLVNLLLAL